jgi:alpha-L-arabinofuranosidase
MSDLIFENIGGQELINIARNDTVNGQTILYQPIKNLTAVQQQYNPNNIVSLQATSDKYFQNFSIKFDEKVPTEGTGPDGSHVYIDPETGELVVEAVNMAEDEQIELEITISGTIYEADI